MNLGQPVLNPTSSPTGRLNLGLSRLGSEWPKPSPIQNFFWKQVALMAAMTGAVIAGVATTTAGQEQSQEHCSSVVVSRLLGSSAPVCDSSVIRSRAKDGHVFEENQLGISSILAIGPDFSEKEAVAWFQRAAHQGYAPAEVNLAVMYINGWGTAVNYAAGLHWLQVAADQRFARAYYNLGILYLEGKGVRQDNTEAFRWF